jgi:hypothetical protein
VQTTADLIGCPACGAVARAKDRRPTWVVGHLLAIADPAWTADRIRAALAVPA